MPVPQPCQPLEDEVKALEMEDRALRAQAGSSTGAPLWSVLADMGRVRAQLHRKRRELDACVGDHTAALQANLVIMDLDSPSSGAVSRVAHLWDAGDPGSPRDTRAVTPTRVNSPGGSANVSVTGVTATLLSGGVRVSLTGQLELYSLGKLIERAGYSAAVTMALAPTAVPERDYLCDLVMLADPEFTSTGYVDNLSRMLLPLVRGALAQQVAAAFRTLASRELSRAILRAFALTALPANVTISLRRLSIDESGIRFQPTLGTIGTGLSTFSAPPIPPP